MVCISRKNSLPCTLLFVMALAWLGVHMAEEASAAGPLRDFAGGGRANAAKSNIGSR